jgi:hypothetical protein
MFETVGLPEGLLWQQIGVVGQFIEFQLKALELPAG